MTVAALVLAAGRGLRFGEAPKLLAPVRGVPLVRHAVLAALASSARPVIVVLGHRAAEVRAALGGLPIVPVVNPDHGLGLSTSLRAGFEALPPDVDAAVVLLGDMPDVPGALVDGLISRWQATGAVAVVPAHGGRRANPVLLDRRLAPEIAALTGDGGAAPLLRGRAGVEDWAVDAPGVLRDIDKPKDIEPPKDLEPPDDLGRLDGLSPDAGLNGPETLLR